KTETQREYVHRQNQRRGGPAISTITRPSEDRHAALRIYPGVGPTPRTPVCTDCRMRVHAQPGYAAFVFPNEGDAHGATLTPEQATVLRSHPSVRPL
ncbi:MAG: hypothetical protein ACI9OJ_004807, partial [Myxococcota bacterium]